ncbi:hypothetical protein ACILE9_10300 [Capnocytophaga cynodegmi]|uniref:hypothetical protein n=1 Tax=Capnocytophaga cynodegmi TaxID=28189 RepID=UPI0037D08C7F
MIKSSKCVVSKRVKEIADMLILGYNRDLILQNTSKKWKISDRQIDTYISKARILIEQSVKKQVAYDYAKAIRRYEELYRLNIEKEDYKTALSVNKELTTLQGLFKIEVEHSGNIEFICNIPD